MNYRKGVVQYVATVRAEYSRAVFPLSLSMLFLAGCSSAPSHVSQKPQIKPAVAKLSRNAAEPNYVVKRASVRTPHIIREENSQRQVAATVKSEAQQARQTVAKPEQPEKQRQANSNVTQQQAKQVRRQQRLAQLRLKRQRQLQQQAQARRRAQRQQTLSQANQQAVRQAKKPSKTPLTREQYHARYQAELKRRKAEVERARKARELAAERERLKRIHEARRKAAAERLRREALARRQKAQAELAAKKVENVIGTASKQIGTKYVWGGESPEKGFDCSGLVQHSMRAGANVKVPRTAAQQYKAAVKVANNKATRGDLVFFNTSGPGVSHVGIYLGQGKFLHAPRTGKRVTTTAIQGYWKEHLIGFGRVPGACRLPLPTTV